jgi:hypothetical protein
MKIIIASTALVLGFTISAHAAEPATDRSTHQQHQSQPPAPKTSPGAQGTAPAQPSPAPSQRMQHHHGMGEGMKMEGCCCKKEGQQAAMSCADKAAAPHAPAHDHSSH